MADARLEAVVGGDIAPLQRALGQASGLLNNFAGSGSRALAGFGKSLAAGMGMAVGLRAIQGLEQAFSSTIGSAISFNAQLEQSQLAFATMLGSGEQAMAFLQELQQFAEKTPFDFPGLVKNAQLLKAFGFTAQEVIPTLTVVGDAVAGLGAGEAGLVSITRTLGQMRTTGKIMSQDMMQLTSVGVAAWEILAEKMGISISQLRDMVSKGIVPADQAITMLLEGMEDRFGGLMDAQSRTFSGAMSNIRDAAQRVTGQALYPLFKAAQQGANALATFFQGEQATRWANIIAGAVRVVMNVMGEVWLSIQWGLSMVGRAFEALDTFLGGSLSRALGGIGDAIDDLANIGMKELEGSVYDTSQELSEFTDATDKGSSALEGTSDAAGMAAKALDGLRSAMSGLFQPSQGTGFEQQLDAMGAHIDTWDEMARRAADVAKLGSASPWFSMFDIPEDVLAGGEQAIKIWAVKWQKSFYLGFEPSAISMGAVVDKYRELLTSKAAWDGIFADAKKAIEAAGMTVDEDVLTQAMGGAGKPPGLEMEIKPVIKPALETIVKGIISWWGEKKPTVKYDVKTEIEPPTTEDITVKIPASLTWTLPIVKKGTELGIYTELDAAAKNITDWWAANQPKLIMTFPVFEEGGALESPGTKAILTTWKEGIEGWWKVNIPKLSSSFPLEESSPLESLGVKTVLEAWGKGISEWWEKNKPKLSVPDIGGPGGSADFGDTSWLESTVDSIQTWWNANVPTLFVPIKPQWGGGGEVGGGGGGGGSAEFGGGGIDSRLQAIVDMWNQAKGMLPGLGLGLQTVPVLPAIDTRPGWKNILPKKKDIEEGLEESLKDVDMSKAMTREWMNQITSASGKEDLEKVGDMAGRIVGGASVKALTQIDFVMAIAKVTSPYVAQILSSQKARYAAM